MLKIAGVTFKNETTDGGRERQTILKELKKDNGIITIDIVKTTYDGKPAMKCVEHSTRQVIGWIPKAELDTVSAAQMTGFIRESKRGLSVQLCEQKKPTPKQYRMVQAICRSKNIAQPAYDVRAYADIFRMAREG